MNIAVVACMDARLDIGARRLGTREITLIHHTDCGMLTFNDDALKDDIQRDSGVRPPFAMEAFANAEENVRQSIKRIQVNPFVVHKDVIRGFICEVETGRLREVA